MGKAVSNDLRLRMVRGIAAGKSCRELAAWLETEHGVTADPSNLSKLLCKEGFTYKKNAAGLGERTL